MIKASGNTMENKGENLEIENHNINHRKIKESDKEDSSNKKEKVKLGFILYKFIKRLLDIIISTLALILLSPLFLILSIIVKIDSEGPVFFSHKRFGKNGKQIKIYKFRTMCKDAENMIQNFTPEQQKEYNTFYKLDDDPRVTKVGKFLRKISLDELPQLLNILKGDLSIVGPRPVVKSEIEKYGKEKEKLLSVKPGLTGYWQVNGRSNTSYKERMDLELYYVDNISLLLDTKIFLKTFAVVLKKEGAK